MAIPAAAPVTGSRRVAIVTGAGEPLRQLRRSLIADIAARRHRVLSIAPAFADSDIEALTQLGAERAAFAQTCAEQHAQGFLG